MLELAHKLGISRVWLWAYLKESDPALLVGRGLLGVEGPALGTRNSLRPLVLDGPLWSPLFAGGIVK